MNEFQKSTDKLLKYLGELDNHINPSERYK